MPSSQPTGQPTQVPLSASPTGQPSVIPSSKPTSNPAVYQQYGTTMISTSAPPNKWKSVCISSSGQYIVAVALTGGIYNSLNYGYTWTKSSASILLQWSSVTCSSSGQYAYASVELGSIYYSTNYGSGWNILVSSPSNLFWISISASNSGQYVYAVVNGGHIYNSSDYGASWGILGSGNDSYTGVACSDNGQYVGAVVFNGYIYISMNYGKSFVASSSQSEWTGIAFDSSGQFVVVASKSGLYTSQNFGVTFEESYAAVDGFWESVACDSSGQYLYAVAYGVGVYYSNNYGVSWNAMNAPVQAWVFVATSSNGQYVTAVAYQNDVYCNFYSPSSQPSSTPTLSPTFSPSVMPTSQPSSQPSLQPHTSYPTSNPTLMPSSQPSLQPSSFPTYIPDTYQVNQVVLSTDASSTVVFNNLGCGSRAYLTATILVSYLDANSNGYINITVGNSNSGTIIATPKCAPLSTCGGIVCVQNLDVHEVVSCEGGGSITLNANTVDANKQSGIQSICTYEGASNLQYAISYTVSVNPLPTASPTAAPTEPGNIIFNASPTTPFYVIAAITILYAALGVFIVRLRDKNVDSADLSLRNTIFDFSLNGYHLTSEVFYIVVVFSEKLGSFGGAIIAFRLCSAVVGIYLMALIFGPPSVSKQYETKLNKSNVYKHASTYSILIVVILFDHSMIRYFPWYSSNYVKITNGFPDRFLLKMCMLPKVFQLMGSIIMQVIVLSSSNLIQDKSERLSLAVVLLYLISTASMLALFAMSNGIRLMIDDSGAAETTITEKVVVDNPIQSPAIEMSTFEDQNDDSIPWLKATVIKLTNRIIELEKANEKAGLLYHERLDNLEKLCLDKSSL